jgi:F0F1-type ATP synthase assembly protein I
MYTRGYQMKPVDQAEVNSAANTFLSELLSGILVADIIGFM